MKRLLLAAVLILIGVQCFAQGSPAVISPAKRFHGDTTIIIYGNDTVKIYDSSGYAKFKLSGPTSGSWFRDTATFQKTIVAKSNVDVEGALSIGTGGSGQFMFNNSTEFTFPPYISFNGDGLQNVNGYLSTVIGSFVNGSATGTSEIVAQSINKTEVDSTASPFAFSDLYHVTTASSDSAYKSKYYIDNNLFGYSVTGSPSASTVPVFDAGLNSWTFGSGGSGSGDNARIDQTLDNSDYVVGSTTYTGGFWDVSTYTMRGDTGLNIIKSGAHPGDTAIFTPDWVRVMRNNGTQYVYNFRSAAQDTMGTIYDSSTYTIWRTGGTTSGGAGNSGGLKMNNVLNMGNNIRFWGNGKRIDSVSGIRGYSNYLSINSDSALYLNPTYVGGVADVPVIIGSSSNHTFDSDTLRGTGIGSKIFDYGRATIDTLRSAVARMKSNTFKFVSDTTNPTQDVALTMTRDTANDTTKFTVSGKLQISADAGLTEFDSAAYHGRIRMYDGTNKSRIDSASQVLADTVKTLPGGYFAFQGATSGRTRIRGNASAITSYDLTLPAAQGSSSQTLVNDGSGNLSWSSAGGGGNGSADFDSTTSLDSNILKGAGGTILLDIHKSATPNVVIGKGATMTSLIIGGNNSGLTSADTAFLVIKGTDFGNAYDDYARLDSSRVVNAIRLKRYYFGSTDLYWSPEKANAADKMFLTWNLCDTASTWPNNAYKSELFHLVDSVGDSHSPLNLTWNATENDTLLSFNWKYASDSLAGTGSTDTSKIMYPNYAILYVNRTQVDSVFIGKTYSLTPTEDSVNFTDKQIVPGDVVTVLLWFETQVTSTSAKRVRCEWAYLNMRRY